jgi:hypothetical protein
LPGRPPDRDPRELVPPELAENSEIKAILTEWERYEATEAGRSTLTFWI